MQDRQEQDEANGLFAKWRSRLAQAILREPSVILIDRDADVSFDLSDAPDLPTRELVN